MSETHPLHGLLSRVEKPGRYVGGEWNEIRKDPGGGATRVALAYPDVYEIGMSYLGQKILYAILNGDDSVLAERVFAPWPDFERALRSSGRPLTSLENAIPLSDFDVVGFSLLHELNYSNILTILDLGGVPLLSSRRELRHPLVIAGGPAAFNPEPTADFFDLFFIGDGEEGFPEIVRAYRDLKRDLKDRGDVLRALSRMPGVYVPSLYRTAAGIRSPLLIPEPLGDAPARVRKRMLSGFSRSPFPEDIVVPNLRVVFDRVAVEAARGCPQNCRFCQASVLYFPHRPKDPDCLLKTVAESLLQTGYGDCSLSALSISDYPRLEETVRLLMDEISPHKISLSLSSLRPGGLSRDLVANILRVRKTGVTVVPEAGTERLRDVINKKLSDGQIREALDNAFSAGWRLVKFYFMAGLPTEREADLEGIVSLVRRSWEAGRAILHSPPGINVSLSPFIPKPHTPFQWLAMDDPEILEDKKRFVRSGLKRIRSVAFKDHPVEASVLEAVFSRGDRRLGRVLLRAWEKGARFDGWGGRLDFSLWEEAFAEEGVSYRDYLKSFPPEDPLPWDPIDPGIGKIHLLREMQAALRGEASPACSERDCADCGGCDFQSWKMAGRGANPERHPYRPDWLGGPSADLVRYRAFYEKAGRARYLSHIDLINVLQRAFRRAGVPVRQTAGYHPKPDFTYGPALPLGMEGLREVLEFRSPRAIGKAEFLARINRALPAGIRFLDLLTLSPGDRPLSGAMKALVYSIAWADAGVTGAAGAEGAGEARPESRSAAAVAAALDALRESGEKAAFEYVLDGGRLVLEIPLSVRKPPRAQDIVAAVLGIENPAFFLRRDEISFV